VIVCMARRAITYLLVVGVGSTVADRESPLVIAVSGPSGPVPSMRTTGASLLAGNLSRSAHVRTPPQDSRSTHRLLYLAAVQDEPCQLERSRAQRTG
jgi:hypothetical protein